MLLKNKQTIFVLLKRRKSKIQKKSRYKNFKLKVNIMENRFKVFMFPTNEASTLYIQDNVLKAGILRKRKRLMNNYNVYLYIVDTEATIEEKDYCVVNWGTDISGKKLFEVSQCTKIGKGKIHYFDGMSMCWGKHELNATKVITTTDVSFGLPSISKHFIEAYCLDQNTIITNVEIVNGVANVNWMIGSAGKTEIVLDDESNFDSKTYTQKEDIELLKKINNDLKNLNQDLTI